MILGFIGTGKISSSIILGIFKSKLKVKRIYISSRNRSIAKKLANKFGIKPTALALSFVYHQWFITSTVIGATSLHQLKENIEAYEFKLNSEVLSEIDKIHLTCMNPAP